MTALAERYARSSKAERGVILDEFAAVSDCHHKHAIRLLRSGEKPTAAPVRRVRRRCAGCGAGAPGAAPLRPMSSVTRFYIPLASRLAQKV